VAFFLTSKKRVLFQQQLKVMGQGFWTHAIAIEQPDLALRIKGVTAS
jgi:hypothetical protein